MERRQLWAGMGVGVVGSGHDMLHIHVDTGHRLVLSLGHSLLLPVTIPGHERGKEDGVQIRSRGETDGIKGGKVDGLVEVVVVVVEVVVMVMVESGVV
jgi:hypothetical protein